MKNQKNEVHMDLEGQLLEYKKNLSPFYRQKKINLVTEQDLRQGLGEIQSVDQLGRQREMYEKQK